MRMANPKDAETDADWLSISEAAALLRVHVDTLRRWDNSGRFQASRTPTNHRRYRRSAVAALLRQAEARADEDVA